MRGSRVHILLTMGLLALTTSAALAQTDAGRNLISNPSFENHRRCPDKINPVGVLKIVNAWFQPTSGSADYYNVCGGIECFVPNNKLGFQHPRTGEGYCGIYCSKDNYREYLQTQLERPLKEGRRYRLSFFVSLSEYSTGAVATVGGLLTNGQTTFPNATLYVSTTENAACTPDGAMARMAGLWAQVQKAYSGRVVTFADSVQLFDGLVKTMPAPGHTPGHTTYSVGNCLIAGDIIHAQGLQLQHPDFCAAYDNNPADAVKTRKEILQYAADHHLLFCDAHCVDQFIKL